MQSIVLPRSLMLDFVSWSMRSVFQVQRKQPSLRVLSIRMDTNKAFQTSFHYALVQLSWINYRWTCWNLCVRLHTLKNGTVLCPNEHSLRKIDLYDEFKQMFIPNPLTDWYQLDKYILTPGSITSDEDKEHDEFDESNQTDVLMRRTEWSMKNKQM